MARNPIDFVKNSFVTKSKKNRRRSLSLSLSLCLCLYVPVCFFLSLKRKKDSRILNTLYNIVTYTCTSNLKEKNFTIIQLLLICLFFSSFKTLQETN